MSASLEAQAEACADRQGPQIKKAQGRYYTPPAVVEVALVGLPLEGAFCDFACGSGHFLVAEAERRRRAGQSGAAIAEALYGRDLDEEAVRITRARLAALLGEEHRALIEARVQPGDGLAPFNTLFDAVAANPPYRAGRLAALPDELRQHIPTAAYQLDPYLLFLDRALRLLKPGGRAALVMPDTWLVTRHGEALRRFALGQHRLERLVRLPAETFAAGVEATLAFFTAGSPTPGEVREQDLAGRWLSTRLVDPERPGGAVARVESRAAAAFLHRSRDWTPLIEVAEVTRGVNPYHHTTHTQEEITQRIHHAKQAQGPEWRSELRGRHLLGPYQLSWPGDGFVRYGRGLKEPRHPRFFEGPRLLVRKILGATLHAAFTDQPFVCDQSIYVVLPRPDQPWPLLALLACLNSRCLAALLRSRHAPHERLFPQLKVADLKQFPLPPVSPQSDAVQALATRVAALGLPSPPDLDALEAEVEALYRG